MRATYQLEGQVHRNFLSLCKNYEFADGLTKVDKKLMYMFRAWLESPMAVLVEHPENATVLARLEDSVAKKKKTSEKIEQAFASMLTTLPFRPHV